jgi:hypothetical protein
MAVGVMGDVLYYIGDRGPFYFDDTMQTVQAGSEDETEDAPADATLLTSFRTVRPTDAGIGPGDPVPYTGEPIDDPGVDGNLGRQMNIGLDATQVFNVMRLTSIPGSSGDLGFVATGGSVRIGGAYFVWRDEHLDLDVGAVQAQQSWFTDAPYPTRILIGNASLTWESDSLVLRVANVEYNRWEATTPQGIVDTWTLDAGNELDIGFGKLLYNTSTGRLELWAGDDLRQEWPSA